MIFVSMANNEHASTDGISKNKFALYFSMKSRIHYAYRYICVQPATPKVNKGHKEKHKLRFDTQISLTHQAIKSLL